GSALLAAIRDVLVGQRELAAEQVEDAGVRLRGLEQARDRVARARGRVERARVATEPGMGVDGVRAGDREQLAAAFVQLDMQAEERLETPAEAAARASHALCDRPDAPPVRRVEVKDAIGLAVADRAQDDGLGLDWSGHRKSLGPRAAAPCARGRVRRYSNLDVGAAGPR